MSVIVKIPTPLRPLTSGSAELRVEGATVGEVLRKLDSQFSGFGDRVFDGSTNVKRFINVYVNEDNIRDRKDLDTEVTAGDTVVILPSIAGGNCSSIETEALNAIHTALQEGRAVPYLGPGALALADESCELPSSSEALATVLTASSSVPHKIRKNLTAAAQFIENFKHRKTVSALMTQAFRSATPPPALHRFLATLPALPLIVHAWYDDLPQKGLGGRGNWGTAQGVSQAEHFGEWVHLFDADGSSAEQSEAAAWTTLLYQPFGSVSPASNFLVSDSDFVEVLTEIDIQTPIPEAVQRLRAGRHFLFLGCRFATQLERLFARQIMKRSSAKHWAVLPEEPTRNEARFLAEQNIERINMSLSEFSAELAGI